jgi:hypothetical protein
MGYNISYGLSTPRSVGTLDYKHVANIIAKEIRENGPGDGIMVWDEMLEAVEIKQDGTIEFADWDLTVSKLQSTPPDQEHHYIVKAARNAVEEWKQKQ